MSPHRFWALCAVLAIGILAFAVLIAVGGARLCGLIGHRRDGSEMLDLSACERCGRLFRGRK